MPSSPLDSTNGRTTSGVACHHHLWSAHTVERRRAWHAIIALRQHTQSKDVGRGMTSPPLDSTHDRTTSGLARDHRPWTARTVERRRAWHDITTLGRHTQSNVLVCGMPSSPLGSTHDRMTSCVAFHHLLWAVRTVDIVGRDIPSWPLDTTHVGRGMPSSPLGSTHGRTASGVACQHRPCTANTIERHRVWHASSPLGSIHGRTTSGVACHNRLKAAHTVERRRAWHDITAFVQHTR